MVTIVYFRLGVVGRTLAGHLMDGTAIMDLALHVAFNKDQGVHTSSGMPHRC